ncbi:MAG: sulfotransferase [Verrucomicrobiota bacterium]
MNRSFQNPTLGYILSLPRSGSTVLSALLDRKQGIVSPPESSFPQMLGMVPPGQRTDSRWLAALYLGTTFPPTPLSLDDAEACMQGSNEEILIALGKAVAVKLDRDPNQIKAVVWKTPRMVGMHRGPLSTSGKFIVLRRNPHNVFESQFRVDFGKNNRNPYRFAIFRESYENAFSRLPKERVFDLHYDSLPGALQDLMAFLGVEDQGDWESRKSSLDLAAENCYWMSEVTQEFQNKDPEKRARLDPRQVETLDRAMRFARLGRSFLGPVRSYFDHQSLLWSRDKARSLLQADADDNQCA